MPDKKWGKLDAKSRSCIFLGLANGVKASVYEYAIVKTRLILWDGTIIFIYDAPPAIVDIMNETKISRRVEPGENDVEEKQEMVDDSNSQDTELE